MVAPHRRVFCTSSSFLDRHALGISGYLTFLLACLFPVQWAGTVVESNSRCFFFSIRPPSQTIVSPPLRFPASPVRSDKKPGGSIGTILIKTEPNLLTNLSASPRKHRKAAVSHGADTPPPLVSLTNWWQTPPLHASSVTFAIWKEERCRC